LDFEFSGTVASRNRAGWFAMGRRALKKIDPSLDLSAYLLSVDDLPCPWDALPLFGRRGLMEVEVGTGKGLFITTAAAADPHRDFIGIEISQKYSRFAAAQLARRRLHNARLVHGDALRVFSDVFSDACLDAVHIYFPDPWWKKRHRKRRVMRSGLLQDVQRTLKSGGTLHFWTDVEAYFNESLELLSRVTNLVGPLDVGQRAAEHTMDYRTHFERRMRLHGEPVYRAEFQKAV
jgi:tRNA (guanine-N7-)-methyltransferase